MTVEDQRRVLKRIRIPKQSPDRGNPFDGSKFFSHCRRDESQIAPLDHWKTGSCLCSDRKWINAMELQHLANARMAKAISAGGCRKLYASLLHVLIVLADRFPDMPRPHMPPPRLF